MKVLVTGGNGFIGRHIVKELHKRGMKVVSLDIVPPLERLSGVSYADDTIMDKYTLSSYMHGCDAVFHLAAMLGVRRSDKQLLKCLNVNIQGTVNALEACRMSEVPYFLFTSSSEIYGDVNKNRVSEESPLNPKSVYAISKLAGEQYVKAFSREYGMKYNIIRFFNIYRPRAKWPSSSSPDSSRWWRKALLRRFTATASRYAPFATQRIPAGL